MNVQILRKDGQPEYAVVPYELFEKLVEDAEMLEDIAAYDKAKRELASGEDELVPYELSQSLLNGANPIMAWRKYRGWTQAALAEKVGVQQAAIAQYENGKREPAVKALKIMAEVLNVDLDDLV